MNKRTHQINGKSLYQATEYLSTAINESTGFWVPKGEAQPKEITEARKLMERAQALLIKAGRTNDKKADTDFFSLDAQADAGWIR